MRIIERALQEAEAKAKSVAHSAVPESPVRDPVSVELPADHGRTDPPDELALTSRDLKAIVQIDLGLLRAAGRLPPTEIASQTEDEIRRIKWPLLQKIFGSEGLVPARSNIILVTSALPGEGKTFTALNLALSVVRDRELRVVLVDGDVARPGLTPTFGLEGRPGLNDALEDTSRDVATVTYQTDVDGLFFVPSGKWHSHAPEFFAGSRMPQILESLSRRVGNGVIIIDSPPLLATNEAQVATRLAGQVLLVVRAEETPQQAVLDAIALVDQSTSLSAVLNAIRPSVRGRYYGQYYHGSGYAYGYGRGRPTDTGAT